MQSQKTNTLSQSVTDYTSSGRRKLSSILYVEDSVLVQKIAKIALRDIGGFAVDFCTTGIEALVAAAHTMPDLILLDRTLPDMTGMELLQRLRREAALQGVPVVFITAATDPQDLQELRRLSQMPVIRKPFNPKFLATTVEHCWENYWHAQGGSRQAALQ